MPNIATAHDNPDQSVHDDEDVDFWAVLHYDPSRPRTNIFGTGPFGTKAEAEDRAASLRAMAEGGAGLEHRCTHEVLVIPMFATEISYSKEGFALRKAVQDMIEAVIPEQPKPPLN